MKRAKMTNPTLSLPFPLIRCKSQTLTILIYFVTIHVYTRTRMILDKALLVVIFRAAKHTEAFRIIASPLDQTRNYNCVG